MQGRSPALLSLPDRETGFSRVGASSPDSSGRRESQAAGAVRVSPEPPCSVANVLGVPLLPRWDRCLEGHPELPGLWAGGSCVSALAGRVFTTAPLGSPPLLHNLRHISLVYITVWSFRVIKFLCSISNAEKFLVTVQLSSYKCLELP